MQNGMPKEACSEQQLNDVNYNFLKSHFSSAASPLSDTVGLGVDRAHVRDSLSLPCSDTVSLGVDRAHVATAGAWGFGC
jgi:hypothetical protein